MQQLPQDSAGGKAPVGGRYVFALRRFAVLAGTIALACSAGGCAISYPIGSMVPDRDDVTASIKPRAGQLREEEDRRRASAAMATALDPQGPGTLVNWDNPASGNKGSYRPAGPAYPSDARICRPFAETSVQSGTAGTYKGVACTVTGRNEWTVTSRQAADKS